MSFSEVKKNAVRTFDKRYWSIGERIAEEIGVTYDMIVDKNFSREVYLKVSEWYNRMKNESYLFHDEYQAEMTNRTGKQVYLMIKNYRQNVA
jgi:hypothetical protein